MINTFTFKYLCILYCLCLSISLNNGENTKLYKNQNNNNYINNNTNEINNRRLQFETMFENSNQKGRRKKGKNGNSGNNVRVSRGQALKNAVDEIILNTDMYNLWWIGPPDSDIFQPAKWGSSHRENTNALFTMAVIQGKNDIKICSSPNDFKLFLGSIRRVFQGDIVMAIENGINDETKNVLIQHNVIVYELREDLCSRATRSIFCGSADERVPASVFRYYFYEKWALHYSASSLLMFLDFRDIIFQSDPFLYRVDEWFPEYQLVLFQEFHPNMVINRCAFNTQMMGECYGTNTLRLLGNRVIISSGAAIGTRDAILTWSHYMTLQLQEASGRMVETRCTSGGIDHAFLNWMTYGNKLRHLILIKLFPQGEGAVNTVGGLKPDTVKANITGDLKSFWHVLDDNGHILNWNGEISPVVHQLDHFLEELENIVDSDLNSISSHKTENGLHLSDRLKSGEEGRIDRGWQALAATRCLWGCKINL